MKRLSRKRFIKLCMAAGYSRNEAENLACRAVAFAKYSPVPDYSCYYLSFVLVSRGNVSLREFLRGCEIVTSMLDAGYCDTGYVERWLENMVVRTSRGRLVLPCIPGHRYIDSDYEVRTACVKMRSMMDEFGYLRIDKDCVRERAIDQLLQYIAPCIEFNEKPCGSFNELTGTIRVLVKREDADNE